MRHSFEHIMGGDLVRELRVGKRASTWDMVSIMMLASDEIERLRETLEEAGRIAHGGNSTQPQEGCTAPICVHISSALAGPPAEEPKS